MLGAASPQVGRPGARHPNLRSNRGHRAPKKTSNPMTCIIAKILLFFITLGSFKEPAKLSALTGNFLLFSFPGADLRPGKPWEYPAEIFFLNLVTITWYEKSHSCKKAWEIGKSI
jgi:hypothetical protein